MSSLKGRQVADFGVVLSDPIEELTSKNQRPRTAKDSSDAESNGLPGGELAAALSGSSSQAGRGSGRAPPKKKGEQPP